MSGLAIPWLVLVTTGSPAKTGFVGFAEMAPYVLFQATVGPVVDRIGVRRSCITGNVAAAALVCAVPGLYALGRLSIWALVALVAFAGAARGASDAATTPMFPRTAAMGEVPSERAAGMSSVAQRAGMLVGLPLAGVVIAASNAPTVVLADGVTFAIAAIVIGAVVPRTVDSARPGESLSIVSYLGELREGIRFLIADRLVGGLVLMIAVTNLLDEALSSVFIPVWVRSRLHDAGGLGVVGGVSAGGLVAGALVGTWLGPRFARRATYSIGFLIGGSPVFFALAFSHHLPPVIVVGVVAGFAAGFLNPIIGAVAYERIPERLQTRVLGALRSSAWIGIPLGPLFGGLLVAGAGLPVALVSTGAAMFVTTLAPFVFPVWGQLDRDTAAVKEGGDLDAGPRTHDRGAAATCSDAGLSSRTNAGKMTDENV